MAGHEIEFKFAADEASLAKLRRNAELKAITVGPVLTRRQVSTYHDTTDDRLFEAGIAWQIKRQGRAWQQTVKPINGAGAIHSAADAPIKGPQPDPTAVLDTGIADALKCALKDKKVVPRVATDIRRTERRLVTERGDILELSLDTADVTAGEAKDRAFEVELELKAGTPDSLIELARSLAQDMPLELSLVTAAERGFLMLKGMPPGKAPWLVLPSEASASEALSAIISASLKHIALHAAEARRAERSEAIHQIRVGLRRLRSALQDYARAFESEPLKLLAGRARDLAALLSPARDLDVFLSDFLAPAETAVTYPDALAQLSEQARTRRAAAWATAKAALDSADYRLLLIDLAAVALCGVPAPARDATPPPAMLARSLAVDVLDRRLGKARGLGEHFATLSTEERHELRKQLKKLRYPAEFFASLFDGKGAKRFFASLTDLQDDLGRLNDVATARMILQDLVRAQWTEGAEASIRQAMTAGEIIGWHAHRADKSMARVAKHWEKFDAVGPFWRKK